MYTPSHLRSLKCVKNIEKNSLGAIIFFDAVLGGVCTKEFSRPTAIDRKMICVYEKE
jgi:hypothetical protein